MSINSHLSTCVGTQSPKYLEMAQGTFPFQVFGAPPDSVRCTREPNSKLATFGNLGGRSAIIHRTVRCTKRSNGSKRQWSSATATVNRNSADCARIVRADVRRRTGQWTGPVRCTTGLSGDPAVRSSNGRNPTAWWRGWRTGQCPVAHRTVRCAIRLKPSPTVLLVVGAINTPQPPHFNASKFSAIKPHTRALDFIQRHNQRDQILSQVRNHSKQISD
jgi:hypothetical protein